MRKNDRGSYCLKARKSSQAGFTLLETLVVTVVIGVLASIAVPSWVSLVNNRQLNAAQDRVLQIMRQAQFTAKFRRASQIASFRNVNGIAYWAVHPDTLNPNSAIWHPLEPKVQIDESASTLRSPNKVYQVEFNYKGNINGQLGRLTLLKPSASLTNSKLKRCVIVSTLLGQLRTGQETRSSARSSCD
jgi:prepilin-type N-terminal cleavage/methylation domain-containing protein